MKSQYNKKVKIFVFAIMIIIVISLICVFTIKFFFKGDLNDIKLSKNNDPKDDYKAIIEDIPMVNITETYINVCKDGKWGYIDTKGNTVIDFSYDFAIPFAKMKKDDKEYEVALVEENDQVSIILKDETKIFSKKIDYPTDELKQRHIDEYELRYSNLISTLRNTFLADVEIENFGVGANFKYIQGELNVIHLNEYVFDYNDEYNLVITRTRTSDAENLYNTLEDDYKIFEKMEIDCDWEKIEEQYNHKYELVKKDDDENRIQLECDHIVYYEDKMPIFKNGNIPFYNSKNKMIGWFTPEGKRKRMNEQYMVLDFIGDNLLIKDQNTGKINLYDKQGKIISPTYLEIQTINEGYVVKKENGKCTIVDKNFNEIIDEYDYISLRLYSVGLLVCANSNEELTFNSENYADNMQYELLDVKRKENIV